MSQKLRVFFGHDYFRGDKVLLKVYRRKVQAGCRAAARSLGIPVDPVYGDTRPAGEILAQIRTAGGDINGIQEGRFWPRIDALLRVSDLAIFDLTLPTGPDTDVNWNVLMELGVALGARLKIRIIVRSRPIVQGRLTNMAGLELEECSDPRQLGMLVKDMIVAFAKTSGTASANRTGV